MPQFQIRYQGEGAPDPETLVAQDVGEALAVARARFAQAGADRAVLWAQGAMIQIFVKGDDGPRDDGMSLDQQFAAAGVYRVEVNRTEKS